METTVALPIGAYDKAVDLVNRSLEHVALADTLVEAEPIRNTLRQLQNLLRLARAAGA